MRMKTFTADTMQEALSLVKEEMGPDAVILKSRRTTRRSGSNKNEPCFEVTAALEESLFAKPQADTIPGTVASPVARARASADGRAARKPEAGRAAAGLRENTVESPAVSAARRGAAAPAAQGSDKSP